jgi:hypothetical protein
MATAITAVALAAASGQTLIERVQTTPTRRAANGCAFLINARLVGGGRQTTCITGLDGVPGPGVVMHSRGVMRFHLKKGSIRARVRITQRFGSDGVHAHQTVRGSIIDGTRAYRGARGTINGRGTVTDRPSGLGPVNLRYTLRLTSR